MDGEVDMNWKIPFENLTEEFLKSPHAISIWTIKSIQQVWHEEFHDEWVPDDEVAWRLSAKSEGAEMVWEAIEITANNPSMFMKSYDARLSYVSGVIKNLCKREGRKRWEEVNELTGTENSKNETKDLEF